MKTSLLRGISLLCAVAAGGCAGGASDGGGTGGGGGMTAGTGGAGGSGAGNGGTSGGGGTIGGSGGASNGGAGGGGASGTGGSSGGSANGGSGGGLPPDAIIVQDNFDSTTGARPDAAKWSPYSADPTCSGVTGPAIDTSRAHSPPNATVVTPMGGGGCGSFLVPVAGFPVTGNAFYVRVFINWEKATSAITGHGGFIVGSVGRYNNGTEVRLGISNKGPGGVPRVDLNVQMATDGGEVTRYSNGFTDGGNPGAFTGTGYQFAANTWYCVEAFFNGAAAQSEFRLWIDSAEIQEMHVTNFQGSPGGVARNMWAPTYRFLKIGGQDYDSSLGRIWYDDVVVATSRVGCN